MTFFIFIVADEGMICTIAKMTWKSATSKAHLESSKHVN
jgi:hypothetical protein